MPRRAAALILVTAAAATFALGACHDPKGGIMPYTGGSETYYSWEHLPATITLVDTRTDEVVFTIDVPPGKQLCVQFVDGEGDDPVYTPDVMLYDIMDRGTRFGKLRNSVTVPSSDVRRLDVSYREGPELRPRPDDFELSTGNPEDRPQWWTSKGGKVPGNKPATHIYDE